MDRLATRAGLLLLTLAAVFMVGFSKPEEHRKAIWIWQADRIESESDQLLTFVKQNEVNLLYLHVDMDIPQSSYREFIREAAGSGIEVHALAGHPAWALDTHRDRMMKLIQWVKMYNDNASPEERIRGIHLDIEPYLLPEWETEREALVTSWMGNMEYFLQSAKDEVNVEISADMPVWFDSIAVAGMAENSLAEWMIKRFDHITLMAYRHELEGDNGILELVKHEMEMGDKHDAKLLVGVNAKPMEEKHTTFYNKGTTAMKEALQKLTERLGAHPSFAGTSIHDYRYWRSMEERETDLPPGPDPQPQPDPDPDWVPVPPPIERAGLVVATYVWRAELAIEQPDEIISFAREQGINLLYVRLDLEQSYDAYRSFVKKAHEAGIEMHAMGGHPIWALSENEPRMLRLVNYVKQYNRSVEPDERFNGIHLDVEPYVLPDWQSRKDDVLKQWTANMDKFVQETKRNSDLLTSIDLAVWLDRTSVPERPDLSISEYMIGLMDHVSLMAFRNTAEGSNGIAAVVKEEMKMSDLLGKQLVITVEMKENLEGKHISFHELGVEEMLRQLAKLPELLQDHPSYIGNAVHAYDYWHDALQ
ncbi:hypothetical protein [Paenibacillus apiarius]|uniref:Uncharacterized protein n=1 Tax=Paenibacillus apiarius TaxID=46240 RepID=A0ABT4DLV2_9BACL|nr:hypothetical protein [Paenibacillus apiarius]MCY9518031.1 hypothetical protein [Paenibacillus apiarius]MCY9518344.1 hypothetical protein [Paenibacillus apiarius]MCY9551255.1 hypothetical protein [Paenibacillus apiarius]MCY9558409.1 hypothetical protein [Paenibacillus apiarius]MCY9684809.1 hypothetical protein [Paenibacillus apiarius]